MSKKNQIKFKNFEKAVAKYLQRHFDKYHITEKRGSGIRYEIFSNSQSFIPLKMWVVHKDDYIHKGDLKKTCENLNISIDDFMKLVE